jgi:dihydropteroate synthase
MVVSIRTNKLPLELLTTIKTIEVDIGRTKTEHWGPREIDIDIIYHGQTVLEVEEITVPHKERANRAFVLTPLAELLPNFVDPVLQKSAQELSNAVDGTDIVKIKDQPTFTTNAFKWGTRTYVMGIVNCTPDSFSDDGILESDNVVEAALAQVQKFVEQGVDIVDVGGQSTRPGAEQVSIEEELNRVIPTVKAIRAKYPPCQLTVSIDTFNAEVAKQSLAAGANWINDVWALQHDKEIINIAVEANCPVVLMHNSSNQAFVDTSNTLGNKFSNSVHKNVVKEVKTELQQLVEKVIKNGVKPSNVIIDPGVGFGKSVEENFELIKNLKEFIGDYPILIGTSRKSFIGYTLNTPPEDRLGGTAASVAVSIQNGADIIRVHDTKEMVQVALMTDKLIMKPL